MVPPTPPPSGLVGSPKLSADGRYVAFASDSPDVLPGDTNKENDVFVHDRHTGTTTLVSQTADGGQADRRSWNPEISDDGFASGATNLVAEDTHGDQIFVRDLHTDTTTVVSVAADGTPADGRSWYPSMSADGRVIAFVSSATNLVPDDTNGLPDVFVRDLDTGSTTRASVATGGGESDGRSDQASISADGRYVAFSSTAIDLAYVDQYDPSGTNDVFVHDLVTLETTRVSTASGPESWRGSFLEGKAVSADGRYVVFSSNVPYLVPGDTNGESDLFLWDREG